MSPQKYRALKFSAVAVSVMVVSGCGGGSSSGDNAPASISAAKIQGKVIDGYIQGATVFWDCNKNDMC